MLNKHLPAIKATFKIWFPCIKSFTQLKSSLIEFENQECHK